MANLLFNIFVLFTVISAIGVVVCRNAVNAAMCLLLSLTAIAGLFVHLDAYLLGFLLLLVYAGAIVALFLFIIMLLDTSATAKGRTKHLPLFARFIAVGLVGAGIVSFLARGRFAADSPIPATAVDFSLKQYAYQLFTVYLLPVQILGFLLLIAMLGVIVLSKKFEGLDDIK